MRKNFAALVILILGIQLTHAQSGNFAEINGAKIYYEVHGEGEALLLLHGYSLSHKAWDKWIPALSKKYKLVIPDLRGHGESNNPLDYFTFEQSADDMFTLMDQLNIKRFHAMGQSGGALTLIHMATIDTSRITSMILVAGTNEFPMNVREVFKGIKYEDWKDGMAPHHPRGEEQMRKLIKHLNDWSDNYGDMNFTAPYLSTIVCPTLIIHGDRDNFYEVDIPMLLYQSIPNSYLWIVPNEGHIPIGIYDRNSMWSNILHRVIEEFFAGNWRKN